MSEAILVNHLPGSASSRVITVDLDDPVDVSAEIEAALASEAAVVVLRAVDDPVGVDQWHRLVARGVEPGRLVVELRGGDLVARSFEFRAVHPEIPLGVDVSSAFDLDEPARVGREVGLLTVLLDLPVVTLRGTSSRRVTRVRAVLSALDGHRDLVRSGDNQ